MGGTCGCGAYAAADIAMGLLRLAHGLHSVQPTVRSQWSVLVPM